MSTHTPNATTSPFNSPVEVGLRALSLLNEAYPASCSLQRLVVFDYLVIHSDDVPDGPLGLHPQTPHRGGEILVRRKTLQAALLLFQSRGLIHQEYRADGVFLCATDRAGSFLDTLSTEYVALLRERAAWVVERFGDSSDGDLGQFVRERIGQWGAEFEMESVLWSEDSE